MREYDDVTNDEAFAVLGARPSEEHRPVRPDVVGLVRRCGDCGAYSAAVANECATCGGALGSVESLSREVACEATRVKVPERLQPESHASRGHYVVMAMLFGDLGAHNFYAGRTDVAFNQLGLGLITFFTYVAAQLTSNMLVVAIGVCLHVVAGVWALGDAIRVREDGNGYRLR